jgi:hypothetical protein
LQDSLDFYRLLTSLQDVLVHNRVQGVENDVEPGVYSEDELSTHQSQHFYHYANHGKRKKLVHNHNEKSQFLQLLSFKPHLLAIIKVSSYLSDHHRCQEKYTLDQV